MALAFRAWASAPIATAEAVTHRRISVAWDARHQTHSIRPVQTHGHSILFDRAASIPTNALEHRPVNRLRLRQRDSVDLAPPLYFSTKINEQKIILDLTKVDSDT